MTEPARTAVVAASSDGRTFTFHDAAAMALVPGDLVVLRVPDGELFLARILTHDLVVTPGGDTAFEGNGLVIGALAADGTPRRGDRHPFSSAALGAASSAHLEALQRATGAELPIGTWSSCGIEVAARLRSQGFGRHTFLCGQSGSGKTYALGVVLEQLLLETDLRMVVLDPNADFVKLGETRPDAPAGAVQRLSRSDIRVLGADSTSAEPLRLRFATMPRQAQAAVLRLDPLADRGEYNMFLRLMSHLTAPGVGELVRQLREGEPEERALAQRIENLGLPEWEVWARDLSSAAEVVGSGARLTVLNLSGFRDPHEPRAVSLDLVEQLWAQRESRTPTLIVVDEAHNLCPARPSGPVQSALVDRLVQIAAEGRKYGLWLLLSTQQPSKIHPNVLSQCDNLALMRMNSPGDIAELAGAFGFAPPAMLRSSQFFDQGEALVAGAFVPAPAIVRMGRRLTLEGGGDVGVPVS